MPLAIAIALFGLLTLVITLFGYHKYVVPGRLVDRLTSDPEPEFVTLSKHAGGQPSALARFIGAFGGLLPMGPADIRTARRDLVGAGIRAESAVATFFGSRVLGAALLLGLSFLFRNHITVNPVLRIVILFAGAGAGYSAPGFVVGWLTRSRHEQLRFALPDVLDMLVVGTEAGCGLDQAMVNVSRELMIVHPAICEELTFLNLEMLAGSARADALRGFADRTGEDEIKKLVAILIQTDRFGTSISDALRTQSDFLRIRRRQEAEERAGKVGVKLVFPIFFFCMPSLLVVTAGPGILQLMKNLLPAMNNLH